MSGSSMVRGFPQRPHPMQTYPHMSIPVTNAFRRGAQSRRKRSQASRFRCAHLSSNQVERFKIDSSVQEGEVALFPFPNTTSLA